MKIFKRLFSLMMVTALMFTFLSTTVQAVAAPKVKITWNANGGKIGTAKTKTISYTKGKKIAKLQAAKQTGYTLKGWYTKKSGGTKVKKSTKATKKTTYYAQWTAKQYTLTFDANGGTVNPASRKVAYKKGYGTLLTPSRDGYTSDGWYTAKSGGTKVSATTKMAAKNVTVYAQWKKALSTEEKALVGVWGLSASGFSTNIEFKPDGTYYSIVLRYSNGTCYATCMHGNYSAKGGIYTLTNLEARSGTRKDKPPYWNELSWTWTDEWHSASTPTRTFFYAVETDDQGKYLVNNENSPLTESDYNAKWRIVQ